MRLIAIGLMCLLSVNGAFAIPGTDISLFKILTTQKGIELVFSKHLVKRKGYDNQPAFTADSNHIYFTRMNDAGSNTDSWRVNVLSSQMTPLTRTTASEYSPTPRGNDGEFSAVIAEGEKQSLWLIKDGKHHKRLNAEVEPVGYHAWINADAIAMFRLAEPHELVLLDQSNKHRVVAKDIGRSMLPKQDQKTLFFVQNDTDSKVITEYSTESDKMRKILALKSGSEDFTWHKKLGFFQGVGSELFVASNKQPQWISLGQWKQQGIVNISRLAVSPDGQWLAVVHQDLGE
ncbi:hypothetical protein [Pleionea sp. CnH1-48]|uniref:TolB family protein n=1 Tax=Pleionea sp. CnH1-48 TaxID=2954494 RepID=UPI0020982F35|nr:hypothetical protein [Pleionea sp. CnH1-48]MCO7222891.1 hypothetical protein [Pleionea sp. CnH1-48]